MFEDYEVKVSRSLCRERTGTERPWKISTLLQQFKADARHLQSSPEGLVGYRRCYENPDDGGPDIVVSVWPQEKVIRIEPIDD